MATRGAMAEMDVNARSRIRLVTNRLVKRLGMDEPVAPEFVRNPHLAQIRELEAHATFLESLDSAIKDEGYSAKPGAEGSKAMTEKTPPELDKAADAESEGVEIGAEVTQDGTPVVVTETVDGETAKPAKGKKA